MVEPIRSDPVWEKERGRRKEKKTVRVNNADMEVKLAEGRTRGSGLEEEQGRRSGGGVYTDGRVPTK